MSEVDIKNKSLQTAIQEALQEISDFVSRPEFQLVLANLYDLPTQEQRAAFVEAVLLDADPLKGKGIVAPEGLVIQRSVFGDGRPTLFCVSKLLPEECWHSWKKVTITFDSSL